MSECQELFEKLDLKVLGQNLGSITCYKKWHPTITLAVNCRKGNTESFERI